MIAPRPALEPSERISAILTGWVTAWTLIHVGMPDTPAILCGGLLFAYSVGGYRRRWITPPEATTEPGS